MADSIAASAPIEGFNSDYSLPIELWIHIISFITNKATLITLCQTCSVFRSISEPCLYHSLSLDEIGSSLFPLPKFERLSQSIQDPRLSSMVVSFSVRLPSCPNGHDSLQVPLVECLCDALDRLLGQILTTLPNLQDLSIHCGLCRSSGRHLYLKQLTTTKLAHLTFDCPQCYHQQAIALFEVFAAPCMHNVTSLTWKEDTRTSLDSSQIEIIESGDYLPMLTKVATSYLLPFAPHFRQHAITSLYFKGSYRELSNFLSTFDASILHLSFPNLRSLLSRISHDPSPYRKLQTMEVFSFKASNVSTYLDYLAA